MGVHLMDKIMDDLCIMLQVKFLERFIDQQMLDEMEIEVKRFFIMQHIKGMIEFIPAFRIIVEEGEAPIIEIPDEDLYTMVFSSFDKMKNDDRTVEDKIDNDFKDTFNDDDFKNSFKMNENELIPLDDSGMRLAGDDPEGVIERIGSHFSIATLSAVFRN